MKHPVLGHYRLLTKSDKAIRTRKKDVPHVYLLGVDDPEMIEIESILKSLGEEIYYATKDGRRVQVGNAYEADPIDVPQGTTLVLIECQPAHLDKSVPVLRFDHHRPGDYGHGYPPEEFLERSSLGQVCKHFGIVPSYRQRVIAAMDHCMVHARKGKCPGIKPDDVKKLSKSFIAQRKQVTEDQVEGCMTLLRHIILAVPSRNLGRERVLDLTHVTWEIDSLEYLCARDVLTDLEQTAMISLRGVHGALDKVVLFGDTTQGAVKAFVRWAKSEGLVGIYHDYERGFAGGYKPAGYTIPSYRPVVVA